MANDLTSNPWVIDTPGAGVISDLKLYVKGVRWIEATTAGHIAEIQDKNGKTKWRSVASAANYVEADMIENIVKWDGIKVPTLGSGKLYIEYA
jgi:hypothetical protein